MVVVNAPEASQPTCVSDMAAPGHVFDSMHMFGVAARGSQISPWTMCLACVSSAVCCKPSSALLSTAVASAVPSVLSASASTSDCFVEGHRTATVQAMLQVLQSAAGLD